MSVSRRRLLQSAGLGATLLAVSGCESAVGLQARVAGSSAAPKPGGTAKLGLTLDLIPGNLLTNTNTGITTLLGLVYNTLTRYARSTLDINPELATQWRLAADGKSLWIKLREDVKFHSGRQFTSADVKFSLQTYADPKWNGQLKSTAAAITGYDTTKPHEVTLSFALGCPSNIFDLLDTAPILDSETAAKIATGERFIGTGPFRLTSWRPNTDLRFVKNPDYFVPGRPYLDEVHARIIPQTSTLLSALKSGQVHLGDTLGLREIDAVTKSSAITAISLTGAELEAYVGANVTAPPLDDVRLRQAIAYALDRDRVADEVFRGRGFASSLPWPKDSPAYDPALSGYYGRDLTRSRSLVAELGKPVPTLPLAYLPDNAMVSSVAQIVQRNLGDAGIDVSLVPLDNAQFAKQLIGGQFPGLWVTEHSWAQMTPSTLAVSAYPFNARKNASHFSSPAYTTAADTAWHLPQADGPQATEAYTALSRQLIDQLFLIEIGVYYRQFAVSSNLRGVGYRRRRELDLTEAFLT
jgi:peptide/nickel transport system substrate-binding protein